MPDAGLTATPQRPATGATVALDGCTVTEVWREILTDDAVRGALVDGARSLAADRTVPELYDALEQRDVPYWLRSWIRSIARGDRRAAWRFAADLAPAVGRDVGSIEDLVATARLLEAGDRTPTVAVVVPPAFREQRREQRTAVCRLLAALATGADVRIVASGLTQRWLATDHRADLPGVREWTDDHRDGGAPVAVATDALEVLDPDGTAVEILRCIASEPAETLSYGALAANPALPSRSTIRGHLGTLADLGLVDRFGHDKGRKVELRAAGREYLELLADEIGVQQSLSECVRGPGKSHQQAVLPRQAREGGEGDGPYRTAYLDRSTQAAAAAAGESGGVALVDDRLGGSDEGPDRTRYVSVDDDRDEVVVAVRATGALQHMVSTAVALASPRLLHRAVTSGRLESLEEPPSILRDARCVGALSSGTLEDAEALREAFIEWGEDLEQLTTKLQAGEYEDRDAFRGEILRSAHGLAGSVAHLLDALGFDLVREVRVPGGLDEDHHAELARSVGVSVAIQSRYGSFATYRQLFEDRGEKRATAFSPDVDASDPVGEFIGSMVLRGPDLHRVRPLLEDAVASPAEIHEDAPEFVVPVEIGATGREATAAVAARVLGRKRIRPTRDAVSLLDALVGSPFAVARALEQLGEESFTREIRPDEVRYALASLEDAELLEDLPPTLGKVVGALLRSGRRLTQSEVADRAGVSTRSVRTHRATLEALDVVDVARDGTPRFALSFADLEDGNRGAYPGFDAGSRGFADAVDAVLSVALPASVYADPSGEVFDALRWPPDPWSLLEDEDARPWVEFAARLVDATPPPELADRRGSGSGSGSTPSRSAGATTVTFGPRIEQQPLAAPAGDADGAGVGEGDGADVAPVDVLESVDVRAE